ncbi:hypothetical protein DERP_003460 [Dermatophagoides pteronyssinus]|uniref:Uncharacterized protein n=1 Tax=Dermatophagoides pteronyssinus TaxID=6956 RepID=A0ABQ8JL92_DERPT|nr:hypothetical protein DERP_003460 [Dermatophagoides pteronyssinus]
MICILELSVNNKTFNFETKSTEPNLLEWFLLNKNFEPKIFKHQIFTLLENFFVQFGSVGLELKNFFDFELNKI